MVENWASFPGYRKGLDQPPAQFAAGGVLIQAQTSLISKPSGDGQGP
jgi:hypothetical protein